MNIDLLRKSVENGISLDPNDYFGMKKCWAEMINILSDDITATIDFFQTACTDEELYWLGAVFEDIVEKTKNRELIHVLRKRLARVIPETYNQQNFKSKYMQQWVDYAEYVRTISSDIDYAEEKLQ